HIYVVSAQCLFQNRNRAREKRFGLVVSAQVSPHPSKVSEDPTDRGVPGSTRVLQDTQAALVERLGLRVALFRIVDERHAVEQKSQTHILWTEALLSELERTLGNRHGLGVLARVEKLLRLLMENLGLRQHAKHHRDDMLFASAHEPQLHLAAGALGHH